MGGTARLEGIRFAPTPRQTAISTFFQPRGGCTRTQPESPTTMLGFFGGTSAEEEPEEQELSVPAWCELLVDRLATSTLIEDRRDAAEELKVLAEGNWESGMNFVGKIGMRPILEALSPRPRDEELTLVLLDCLIELVRVPQDGEIAAATAVDGSKDHHTAEPAGLTPRDTCIFNTEFLLALTGATQQHEGSFSGGFGEEEELMGGMELLVGKCLLSFREKGRRGGIGVSLHIVLSACVYSFRRCVGDPRSHSFAKSSSHAHAERPHYCADLLSSESVAVTRTTMELLLQLHTNCPESFHGSLSSVPLGMQRLADVLGARHKAVRDDMVLLLRHLTSDALTGRRSGEGDGGGGEGGSTGLRQFLAFSGGFERLLRIMREEGMRGDTHITADCLKLIVNVLCDGSGVSDHRCRARCRARCLC